MFDVNLWHETYNSPILVNEYFHAFKKFGEFDDVPKLKNSWCVAVMRNRGISQRKYTSKFIGLVSLKSILYML